MGYLLFFESGHSTGASALKDNLKQIRRQLRARREALGAWKDTFSVDYRVKFVYNSIEYSSMLLLFFI
jgi:hypothetical protein